MYSAQYRPLFEAHAEWASIACLPWDEATREIPEGQPVGPSVILFKKLDPKEVRIQKFVAM